MFKFKSSITKLPFIILLLCFLTILLFPQITIAKKICSDGTEVYDNSTGNLICSANIICDDSKYTVDNCPNEPKASVPEVDKVIVASPGDICTSDQKVSNNTIGVNENCCICITGNKGCTVLANKSNLKGAVWTAIGCIPTNLNGLAVTITRLLFGIGLFLMLIKIIIVGYNFQLSSDPEVLKKGKEEIVSIVMGFIVASMGLVILKFIGLDLLGLDEVIKNLDVIVPW